jgi:hypothetical protein
VPGVLRTYFILVILVDSSTAVQHHITIRRCSAVQRARVTSPGQDSRVKPDRRSTASTPAQSHRGTPWAIGVPASSPGARTSLQQSLLRRFPRPRLCSDVIMRPSRCTMRYNDGGQRDRCTVHCGLRESSSAPQPHPLWPPLASLCCFVSPPCFPPPPHPVADGLQHCLVTRARCSLHVHW